MREEEHKTAHRGEWAISLPLYLLLDGRRVSKCLPTLVKNKYIIIDLSSTYFYKSNVCIAEAIEMGPEKSFGRS